MGNRPPSCLPTKGTATRTVAVIAVLTSRSAAQRRRRHMVVRFFLGRADVTKRSGTTLTCGISCRSGVRKACEERTKAMLNQHSNKVAGLYADARRGNHQ